MKEVTFRVESVTPILFHNVYCMALKKPAKISHDDWEASDEVFKSRLYLQGDKLVIASRMVKGALYAAAKSSGMKQPGKRSTYAELVQSLLFINNPMALEQDIKACTREHGFVTMNGTKKIMRIWPKLDEWSGEVTITVIDEAKFSEEVLCELMDYSGKFCGYGDYRPEFGRFTVSKV